jgi:hypothetical protein
MAVLFWPAELPDGFLGEGLSVEPQNNVVRTAMDAGPKKARRRYTARTVQFTGKQLFNRDEFALFETFYHTALADGVLRFNFTDPVTLETAEFRFCKNYTATAKEGYFDVALVLERMS